MKNLVFKNEKTERLDEVLRCKIPDFLEKKVSNSKIRRLIVAGSVSVNGRQVRIPFFLVRPFASVSVQIDEEKLFFEKQPEDIKFDLSEKDVLFEDDDVIVVNKPSHFPTEAGMVDSRDNLHAAVIRFLFERQKIEKPNAKNPPYVGIMHRLDRDTSGVILFTKSRSVNAACHDMFENHTAQKVYEAVVCVKESLLQKYKAGSKFCVEFPMRRISPKGQAAKWGKVSEKDGGLSSKTEFIILEELMDFSAFVQQSGSNDKMRFFLIECKPLTGRTHQIRVHLASLGIPILGDILYDGLPFDRIMLHAKSLVFPHPVTEKKICVESEFNFPHR